MNENEVNAINPNENVNNKTNTINFVIGIATLLIALLGATFAYFSATARSAENDVTVKSAYVSISYDGGTEIKATNLIPATKHVALSKYMKTDVEVCDTNAGCEIITDYDQYSSDESMWDRKCVDAKGKEVCYVYQFSIESEGGEGNTTDILGSVKINKNQFENLSYVLYEVVLREENGVVLQDKYGFDIVDRYTEIGKFDNEEDEENSDFKEVKFATFEKPFDVLNEEGASEETIFPVACLFGYSKEDSALELRKDDTKRCLTKSITNNTKHTYQLVIWLNETNNIQEEQGMTFEGTVAIEVSGGVSTDEYSDGKITGQY